MAKSVVDKSMRPGCCCEDLDARMLMMDNLRRAKLRRHRRSPITELYNVACFSARRPPSPFKVTVAQGPISPVLDNTKGVKVVCTIKLLWRFGLMGRGD